MLLKLLSKSWGVMWVCSLVVMLLLFYFPKCERINQTICYTHQNDFEGTSGNHFNFLVKKLRSQFAIQQCCSNLKWMRISADFAKDADSDLLDLRCGARVCISFFFFPSPLPPFSRVCISKKLTGDANVPDYTLNNIVIDYLTFWGILGNLSFRKDTNNRCL